MCTVHNLRDVNLCSYVFIPSVVFTAHYPYTAHNKSPTYIHTANICKVRNAIHVETRIINPQRACAGGLQ